MWFCNLNTKNNQVCFGAWRIYKTKQYNYFT